jgi:hypothetical protein
MKKICISGCGDIGQRVAKRFFDQSLLSKPDITVYGLVRRTEVQAELQALGITPVIADLDQPDTLKALACKDAVLFHFAPPPNSGQTDPRFRALLAACEQTGLPAKVILLSTTAVYGDCQGEWIDETAPVNPQTDRGKRRLDAESALHEWATKHDIDYVILRVFMAQVACRWNVCNKGYPFCGKTWRHSAIAFTRTIWRWYVQPLQNGRPAVRFTMFAMAIPVPCHIILNLSPGRWICPHPPRSIGNRRNNS